MRLDRRARLSILVGGLAVGAAAAGHWRGAVSLAVVALALYCWSCLADRRR